MINIVLAGFMGTGKTTVGQLVAEQLGRTFVDTDAEIERREGISVPGIFARDGEAYFRSKERALAAELAQQNGFVIATGGGMIVNEGVRRILLDSAVCVCLTASPDVILERVGGESAAQARPLLRSDDVRARIIALLNERAPAYAHLPYHVDTSARSPAEVAAAVAAIASSEQLRIGVSIPDQPRYDIAMGDGLLAQIGHLMRGRGWTAPAAILSDKLVASHFAGTVQLALKDAGIDSFVHSMPHGEAHKTLATVEAMYRALSERGMDRTSPVIALGGGVVGDTAGFAAATYLRGVPFVQAPTSLLAMADSSIGGKVGVDTPFGKNLVGAFKQPDLVVMDTQCLGRLPAIELRCGYAEIVKCALIAGGDDWQLARTLAGSPLHAVEDTAVGEETGVIDDTMMNALVNAIELKRAVVEEDPYERGRRALLNLGHTFGHGLEAWSGLRIKHGYAVSLGMVCALRLSQKLGLCDGTLLDDSLAVLRGVGLPTRMRDVAAFGVGALDVDQVWAMMQSDKKKRAGRLRFVLLRGPGDVFVHNDVSEADAKAALVSLLE